MFTTALPSNVLFPGADRVEILVSFLLLSLVVFTEMLPGKTLIKAFTICNDIPVRLTLSNVQSMLQYLDALFLITVL